VAYGIQSYTELLLKEDVDSSKESILLEQGPEVKVRGVDKFVMNSGDESWWMDEAYWETYIRMLAEARINRLCFATGFDTEYFSPPYAFLVEVEGYEDVSAAMKHTRKEYLKALRRIGQICHEYHLEFSFAVWQQQPWERGAERLVFGLENQDALCDYCCKGVKKLLRECSEIDAVGEVNRDIRPVKLELRAKGMTDVMTKRGKSDGLDVTVSTKYCCEHAGLPHHLTRMRTQELDWLDNLNMARRYSYSDLLHKPREYRLLYRLWCNGSTDLFVWGDPEYVRKFVRSMEVGDAVGFEVIPPLTLKGGREFDKHTGWTVFANPSYQPKGWEDERYWLFYTLYGRIGYDCTCGQFAWQKQMRKRLGDVAGPAMELIQTASKVIPFVTGFHFPEHPQLWYWPELSTGAALFAENNHHPDFKKENDTYQNALACDEGLFYSVTDYVKANGCTDGRYTPYQAAAWLDALAGRIESLLKKTESIKGSWEWRGIVLDAGMLLELARFHQMKVLAALGLSIWQEREDASYLQDAVRKMEKAQKHWKKLSEMGEAYHSDLLFGAGVNCFRRGSWKDYLPEIARDLAMLEKLAKTHAKGIDKALEHQVRKEPLVIQDHLPHRHQAGENLLVSVSCAEDLPLVMRYRHTNQLEGKFKRLPMMRTADGYFCKIDGAYLTLEWDLLIYFEAPDENGDGLIYPGITAKGEEMPYRLIRIG